MTVVGDLAGALRRAEQAARAVAATTLSGDDPFAIDLPAFRPVGGQIDAPTMELLGGLYLIAQLEQTGLLRAGELLVDQRMQLDLRSLDAAERLEALAQASHRWYRASERDQLFARVFGVGGAAVEQAGGLINRDFTQVLLELAATIGDYGRADAIGLPVAPYHSTSVATAARSLRANLAPRQHGNTKTAARSIAEQVRMTHDLLEHPAVIGLVAGRTLWDVVRAIWPGEPPDIDGFVVRGQAGQTLIGWAGDADASEQPLRAEVLDAAASFLTSFGLDLVQAA